MWFGGRLLQIMAKSAEQVTAEMMRRVFAWWRFVSNVQG
jgi:hypothetical protein